MSELNEIPFSFQAPSSGTPQDDTHHTSHTELPTVDECKSLAVPYVRLCFPSLRLGPTFGSLITFNIYAGGVMPASASAFASEKIDRPILVPSTTLVSILP
jgi:hypothetical protein